MNTTVMPARGRRGMTALAVAVASLLCASGVVVTERLTGRDLHRVVADVIRPDDIKPSTGPTLHAHAR